MIWQVMISLESWPLTLSAAFNLFLSINIKAEIAIYISHDSIQACIIHECMYTNVCSYKHHIHTYDLELRRIHWKNWSSIIALSNSRCSSVAQMSNGNVDGRFFKGQLEVNWVPRAGDTASYSNFHGSLSLGDYEYLKYNYLKIIHTDSKMRSYIWFNW